VEAIIGMDRAASAIIGTYGTGADSAIAAPKPGIRA